jgi:hypothetical protein
LCFLRLATEAVNTPDCEAGSQWCQEQSTQDIGVVLHGCGFPVKHSTLLGDKTCLALPKLRFSCNIRELLQPESNQFYPAWDGEKSMTTTIWAARFAPCRTFPVSEIVFCAWLPQFCC